MAYEYETSCLILEQTSDGVPITTTQSDSGNPSNNIKNKLLNIVDILNRQKDQVYTQDDLSFEEYLYNGEDRLNYSSETQNEIKQRMVDIKNNTNLFDSNFPFNDSFQEDLLNKQTMNTIINNQNQIRNGLIRRRCSCDDVTTRYGSTCRCDTNRDMTGSCGTYSDWVTGEQGVYYTSCYSVRQCNCNSDYLFPCYCNRVYYGGRRYFYLYSSTYSGCACEGQVCGCNTFSSDTICSCDYNCSCDDVTVCSCNRQVTNCQQDCSCDVQRRFD